MVVGAPLQDFTRQDGTVIPYVGTAYLCAVQQDGCCQELRWGDRLFAISMYGDTVGTIVVCVEYGLDYERDQRFSLLNRTTVQLLQSHWNGVAVTTSETGLLTVSWQNVCTILINKVELRPPGNDYRSTTRFNELCVGVLRSPFIRQSVCLLV